MSSICKEPMSWIFRATLNTPKSRAMQNVKTKVLIRYNTWK